jgi:hypothetical protein
MLFKDLLERLFGRFFENQISIEIPVEEEAETDNRMMSIKDILNQLNETFDALNHKNFSRFTSMSTIRTLRAMGPTIIPPTNEWKLRTRVEDIENLPAIIYLANILPTVEREKYPTFFYALKLSSPPYFLVNEIKGVCYEVGFCWDNNKSKAKIWDGVYVVIDDNGVAHCPQVLRFDRVNVRPKKYSVGQYTKRYVSKQPYFDDLTEKEEENVGHVFALFFNLWADRKEYWKVSANKNNRRATFLIDKRNTKTFFKDRDVEALTPSGTKKRIIHFVTEHTRKTKTKRTTVRAHLRGLRDFVWNDYRCYVTAPDFHGFNIDEFDTGCYQLDEKKGKRFMSGWSVMRLLTKLEDSRQSKRRAA